MDQACFPVAYCQFLTTSKPDRKYYYRNPSRGRTAFRNEAEMVDPVAFLPVCILDRRNRPNIILQILKQLRKCGSFWLFANSCSTDDSSEIGVKSLYKLGLQDKITCGVRRCPHKKTDLPTCSTTLAMANFSVSLTKGCTLPSKICSLYAVTLAGSSIT